MKRLLFSLLLLSLAVASYADPRQWQDEGVAVRLALPIYDVSSATSDEGYTLAVWSQSQGDIPVVLGQLMSPDGDLLWEEGGRLLAQGNNSAGYPTVAAVTGGWVIAWFDAEYIVWCDRLDGGWCIRSAVRAIKVDINGAPVWAGGRAGLEIVPMGEWYELQPYQVFRSAGGAIITWRQEYDGAVYALGISGAGSPWPETVPATANLYGTHYALASDDFGGVIAAWTWTYYGDTTLHASRLLPDGEQAWGDTSGIVVRSADTTLSDIMVAADGMGGAYISWVPVEPTSEPRLQHVNAQGEVVWSPEGISLSSLPGSQRLSSLAPSYNAGSPDGVVAIIFDYHDPLQLMAQKLSIAGAYQWGQIGVTTCTSQNQYYFTQIQIQSDQLGGAICFYDRQSGGDPQLHELMVERIASDGTTPWEEACGVVAGTAENYDMELSSQGLTGDGVQVVWYDGDYSNTHRARAQWVSLATGELASPEPLDVVSSNPISINYPKAARLAQGSTAIVWNEQGLQSSHLVFQILNVFGEPMFGEEGLPLALNSEGDPMRAESFDVCPDGSGGFFAAFREVTDTSNHVRAVHINGNGVHVGSIHGTLVIDPPYSWGEGDPLCISDGAGGCYVSSSEYDVAFRSRSLTMRINSECIPQWEDAVELSNVTYDVYSARLVLGDEQSCFVAVKQPDVYPIVFVKMAHVSPQGEVLWFENVADFANRPSGEFGACSDAHGGAYLVWGERSADESPDEIYAQRLSPTGARLWGEHGLLIQDSIWSPDEFTCESDAVGNLTFAWTIWIENGDDVYAQRLSPAGEIQWNENGRLICDAQYYQNYPKVSVLSDNEIYIIWEDTRDMGTVWGSSQTYGAHLNAQGELADDSYWVEGGNRFCSSHTQRASAMVADGAGGVMVVWSDRRTGFDYWPSSVFAQRLYDPIFSGAEETPLVPIEYSLAQNYPNPFNPTTTIEFALPLSGQTTLVVYDITGRETARLLDRNLEAGPYRVSFEAKSLASGVYFYSLRSGEFSETKKMVLLR